MLFFFNKELNSEILIYARPPTSKVGLKENFRSESKVLQYLVRATLKRVYHVIVAVQAVIGSSMVDGVLVYYVLLLSVYDLKAVRERVTLSN